FTIRSHSIPLLILNENREQYVNALQAADQGNYQAFTDFMFERAVDGIRLVDESMRAATTSSIEAAVSELQRLYQTRSGFTREEFLKAGQLLIESLSTELISQAKLPMISTVADYQTGYSTLTGSPPNPAYRYHSEGSNRLLFRLFSKPPIQAFVERGFAIEIPRNPQVAELIIRHLITGESFEANIKEVFPQQTAAFKMRLKITVESILADAVSELSRKVADSIARNNF
ncbi:MAG: hypothetical protein ACKV2V_02930, partial [Blastocatellia bacterium]